MPLVYDYLFPAIWLAWVTYWMAMSRNVKAAERRESMPSRVARAVLLVGAVALLWLPRVPLPLLGDRFLPLSALGFWIGAGITVAGLLFAVWARRHLGRNWSAAVTVKESHELVTSGPYALARHPIYTGILLAFVGSAVARGEWRGVLAVAMVFIGFWFKLRLEESWMRAQFGAAYEAYARRVAALVPYVI
jgi:protein-S-isoprenylcysteine O-methyltransferase Ste14